MKYPKEYLDEIKTRLKVSTVVSKTVSLKKRGKEFVGLSPFCLLYTSDAADE